jgi:cyclopropane fatty-acyl-phospholipid synthase-like methyltransferase
MVWDRTYNQEQKVWGEKPSEAAIYACNFLKQSRQFHDNPDVFILDLGCGYGRDAIFLAQEVPCHILGVDNSTKAIEMARRSLPRELEKRIEFICYDFSRVVDKYDLILCSNLYQILKVEEREELTETIKRCLQTDSYLFLSTLSVNDPQHSGKGIPVENEPNSYIDEKYLHLCTRNELEQDFDFLNISALFEREFIERRSTNDHHHVSWILLGKLK